MSITNDNVGLTRLCPGIAVRVHEGIELVHERLSICSGMESLERFDFAENSFVPTRDWRPLTQQELEKVFPIGADPTRSDAEHVDVWQVPSSISADLEFVRKAIAKKSRQTVVDNMLTHPRYRRAANKVFGYCRDSGAARGLRLLGHFSREPGRDSSSKDLSGKYVGLHVDSWNAARMEDRVEGYPNRLCVNLGPEHRYLQFINLSLRQIAARTNCELIEDANVYDQVNVYVRQFMRENPNYPVLRLTVMPGEAYLAPTEIMIHDGTTQGKQFFDASFTILGEFSLAVMSKLHALSSVDKASSVTQTPAVMAS